MDDLREALETLLEYRKRVREELGEAVHTGFRKGADGGGSAEVWHAMAKCTTFSDAISFARDGLECGLEKKLDKAEKIILALSNPSSGGASVGLVEAANRLANAADVVGVTYFDNDDLSPEVEEMQAATEALRATLSTPLPEGGDAGWCWVPVEPTREMMQAASEVGNTCAGSDLSGVEMDGLVWSAMLSSAPSIDSGFRPSQTDGPCGLQTAADHRSEGGE